MNSNASVVSAAQSIAQSTASQLEIKLSSNKTKTQIRSLLKNIDSGK